LVSVVAVLCVALFSCLVRLVASPVLFAVVVFRYGHTGRGLNKTISNR